MLRSPQVSKSALQAYHRPPNLQSPPPPDPTISKDGLVCLEHWYLIRVVVSRIVLRADVFKSKWSNRRHLRDVLTGFRPVEMGRVAGQNDDGAGWIRLQLIGVELITQADVENAGDNGINSILWVPVWHQLNAVGYSDPDRVGAGLRGLTDNDCQANRGGNAAKSFQSMSSGRTDLKTAWPGWWARTIPLLWFDIAMPGMNGPDLQRESKRRGREVPIIFITASTDKNVRPRLLEQGAVEYLFKPFSDTALLEHSMPHSE
jgi:CheY-like chemotaxis protein